MAKESKKGACSANIQPAKANCLQHARREGKVPSYVNHNLTHTNRTVFEDKLIRGRKSIMPLMKKAEKLYTEKTGQKCQKSFTPFREDVLHIKAGITDEQLMNFKAKAEKLTGWKVVGIWLHQDEGHVHSKYIEGDENFEINYHAHVLYSCQDQVTGKAIRLGRDYFRKRQDVLAECTGMERGNPASETGRRHRSSLQQRIVSQEKRLAALELQAKEREKEKKKLQDEVDKLSFKKASKDMVFGVFGQSSKDKEISRLNDIIDGEPARIKAAVETAKNDGKDAVIDEIKKTADIYDYNVNLNSPKQIGSTLKEYSRANERLKCFLNIPLIKLLINIVQRVVNISGHLFEGGDREFISSLIKADSYEKELYNARNLWWAIGDEIKGYPAAKDDTKLHLEEIAEDRWFRNDLKQERGIHRE